METQDQRLVGICRVRCLPRPDFKGFWTPHRHWPGGEDRAVEVYSGEPDPGMVYAPHQEGHGPAPGKPGPEWSAERIGQRTLRQLVGEQQLQARYYELPVVQTVEELCASGLTAERAEEVAEEQQAAQDKAREQVMAADFDPVSAGSQIVVAAQREAQAMLDQVREARDKAMAEINNERAKAGLPPVTLPDVAPVASPIAPRPTPVVGAPAPDAPVTPRPTSRSRKAPVTRAELQGGGRDK